MLTLYIHGVHTYNFNTCYQNKRKLSTCLNELVYLNKLLSRYFIKIHIAKLFFSNFFYFLKVYSFKLGLIEIKHTIKMMPEIRIDGKNGVTLDKSLQ